MSDGLWIMSVRSDNLQKRFALFNFIINLLLSFSEVSKTNAQNGNSFMVKKITVPIQMDTTVESMATENEAELCDLMEDFENPQHDVVFKAFVGCKQTYASTQSTIEVHLYFTSDRLLGKNDCSANILRQHFADWLQEMQLDRSISDGERPVEIQLSEISVLMMRIEIIIQEVNGEIYASTYKRHKWEIIKFILPHQFPPNYWVDVKLERYKPLFGNPFLTVKLLVDASAPKPVLDKTRLLDKNYEDQLLLNGTLRIDSARAIPLEEEDRKTIEGYPKTLITECIEMTINTLFEIQIMGLVTSQTFLRPEESLAEELAKVQHALKERNNIRIGMDANIKLSELDDDSERLKKIYLYANAVTGSNREIRSEVELVTKAVCNQSLGVRQMFPNGCIAFATHKTCTVYDSPLPVIFILVTGEVSFEDRALNWENVSPTNQKLHKVARDACEVILKKIIQNLEFDPFIKLLRFEGFTNRSDATYAHFALYLDYINVVTEVGNEIDYEKLSVSFWFEDETGKHGGFEFEVDSVSEVKTYLSVACEDPGYPSDYFTVNQNYPGHKLHELISLAYVRKDHSKGSTGATISSPFLSMLACELVIIYFTVYKISA